MRHNKRRSGRAPADELFERALLGRSESDREAFNPREDRKTLQLCRQVQRALILALAGECADEILRDVYVEFVEPMGGPSQLLVRVAIPSGMASWDVLSRLNQHSRRLRTLVAQSICRKRAPNLTFVAVPIATPVSQEDSHG